MCRHDDDDDDGMTFEDQLAMLDEEMDLQEGDTQESAGMWLFKFFNVLAAQCSFSPVVTRPENKICTNVALSCFRSRTGQSIHQCALVTPPSSYY